jgi:hypothetical protein
VLRPTIAPQLHHARVTTTAHLRLEGAIRITLASRAPPGSPHAAILLLRAAPAGKPDLREVPAGVASVPAPDDRAELTAGAGRRKRPATDPGVTQAARCGPGFQPPGSPGA